MNKKGLSVFLTFLLSFSLLLPVVPLEAAAAAVTKAPVKVSETGVLNVSNSKISMTEARDIEVTFDLGYAPDLSKLQWTFGNKPLGEWKKWNADAKAYTGESYITFKETPAFVNNTTQIKATLHFDLLYGTNDVSPRNLRVLYPALIGNYDLAVKAADTNKEAKTALKLNVYDEYLRWDEIKPALNQIHKDAKKGRYVSYEPLGASVEGRPMHFVVVAKNKAAVDTYLKEQAQQKVSNPLEMKKKLASGKLKDFKVPVWINNIHPDESPGVDAIVDLYRTIATKDSATYKTTDEQGREKTVTLNVDKALDNVILLFNFTQNPDGRFYNTRRNANDFDLNRDNTYQTQIETQTLAKGLAKWNPISLIDFHGFYKEFVIEPCTPPHNPNYEYDLLMDGMIANANEMGKAGIANTKYDSYLIPLQDWPNKFDDATPSYTSTFAMFHGTMGHTVEIPDLNAESYKALIHTGLAAVKYASDNKVTLFRNQLEVYARGVLNEDDRAVDEWMVNPSGESIGRPRGNNANFFPEYYVIPAIKDLQKNVYEAHKMVEYMLRNGIKVEQLKTAAKVGKVTYPAGTYVVNMHQGYRGFANALLFKGEDLSAWEEMYSETVNNFPDLRGFTSSEIRVANAFAGKTTPVNKITVPKTVVAGKSEYYVIKNSSNEAVKAVNNLLNRNAVVEQATTSGKGYSVGDFIVKKNVLALVQNKYYLDVTGYDLKGKTKKLVKTKVFNTGSGQTKFVLNSLGFTLVNDAESADVIVDDAGTADKAVIAKGKDYIGIGYSALNFVKKSELLPGFNFATTTGSRASHEGLLWSDVAANTLLTSGYSKQEKLYIATGSYISSVPAGATVLAKVSTYPGYFVSGWWPKHEALKGQTIAITKGNITLFANDLTNKAHPSYSFRFLSNSIFASK
ncbi:M14 family metallopeptidase [Peribacillus deserti]|uniref:X-prolyl-dipeptidyl aminopeptidase n=1 Tax=Peribacillus deserti TaxID=673318 RepID=A0A2N5M339_9BACI|nr:M14 family zinc carboxypeptidase [Peribacillus deserti]PLT28752.1 X-prolyl-dipeptidyl aminopeptidase [Peribacillus deserti]